MTLIDKVRTTIGKYNMLKRQDRILLGLSGGPDSIVLLHVLVALKKDYMLDIQVAHLDHKFRGDQSRKDREFCEEIARGLNLDIVYDEIDVPKIVKERGISSEEAAREVRYDFFKKVAGCKKIKKIAVAHTKDDQAETVLMRMIRGSGSLGLGGMRPVKDMQGFTIIRPLIETSRAEVEGFIKEFDLESRHDSTNDKFMFTRNRVRHELIPYLAENFNPNIKEVLANMAENFREENEFLEKFTKRKFKSMSRRRHSEIAIDIKKFRKQPEAIRKRILRTGLLVLKGNLRRLTYNHWKEMDELIGKRPHNSIVDLPGGVNIIKNKNTVVL
ncbi:MAG: tRNA lysidine(34) synthetase TilS, partial [Candidatus Omnitrophica bacterium]|nr:tRNA lysidine(34) synthetase TilS [Candidatus Omnitrophota bacterium]